METSAERAVRIQGLDPKMARVLAGDAGTRGFDHMETVCDPTEWFMKHDGTVTLTFSPSDAAKVFLGLQGMSLQMENIDHRMAYDYAYLSEQVALQTVEQVTAAV